MTIILLARHGETDWNRDRRVQGHTDTPLNSRGREQARELADSLRDEQIDAVYASDLARAHDTAGVLARRLGVAVTLDPGLREKHFGSWEGLTDEEVLERFPDSRGAAWGDGETSEEMSSRVVATLRRIAAAHPGKRVLVVAHGGPLRAILRHCDAGPPGPIANCQVLRLAVENGRFRAVD